ncbi:hypothetical protein SCUCBS95973_007461 [Sporothrix curviconia]|uniref:Uncharacterized protein n=1 Tax=Sporothrix curviconia TaxID=1260050 RepID=A0ABP0CET1_9PEZI
MSVLRSGRILRHEEVVPKGRGKPEPKTKHTLLDVFIAISGEQEFYKHWSLYVEYDGPDRDKSFICHAQGSAGRFRFEETLRYARTYETICGLKPLGKIRVADAGRLKDVCAGVPVQNETHGWNCQDWVHDAFVVLVDGGILLPIDGVDGDTIRAQMDGFREEEQRIDTRALEVALAGGSGPRTLSSVMEASWSSGRTWFYHSYMTTDAMLHITRGRIQPLFVTDDPPYAYFCRLWHKDAKDIVARKLKDREEHKTAITRLFQETELS